MLAHNSFESQPPRFSRRRTLSLIAAVAVCASVTLGAAPALASASVPPARPNVNYVALGDSYASGQGSEHSIADLDASSGACLRYKTAYPNLYATARFIKVNLFSVACSGATAMSVYGTQLGALSSSTNLVTITAGGNDVGFSATVSACILPPASYGPLVAAGAAAACQNAISAASAAITGAQFAPGLVSLYGAIEAAAPIAKLAVVGYPDLFGAGACTRVNNYFSPTVQKQLDGLAVQLNAYTAYAAAYVHATFVDVQPAFAAHGLCAANSWINSNVNDLAAVLHPTAVGQLAYFHALSAAVATMNVGVAPRLHFSDSAEFRAVSVVGHQFSLDFSAAHGSGPITYSVASGALPPGLSFNASTGLVSGTPTVAGSYSFTWTATNAFGSASGPCVWKVKVGSF